MPRFRKGTNDHDNDGHKGGSMKGDDMARKPKAKADAPKRAKAEPMQKAQKPPEAPKEAKADKLPEAQPKLEDRKAAAEEMFAEADAAAADARMRLAVRGF